MACNFAAWKLTIALMGLGMGFTAALPAEAADIQVGDFNKQTRSYSIDFGNPGLQTGNSLPTDNYLYEGLNGVEQRLRVRRPGNSIVFVFQEKVNDTWTRIGQRLKGLSFANIGDNDSFVRLFDINGDEVDQIFIPAGDSVLDFRALALERNKDYEVASFRVNLGAGESITGVEYVPEPITILGSAAALTMGALYKRKLRKA